MCLNTNAQIITFTDCLLTNESFSKNDKIVIFPNPTKEILNISIDDIPEIPSITIYNTLGQIIEIVPHSQDLKSLDISLLKSGNYFIQIAYDKGIITKKFTKE
ncbi:T9SS type A sorting domain-containing protein [Flavobacterium psychrotolerans]|uniref:T9SS type A sorting domain-containing protein n=1 Tax=Flavobacterium psychrotolerans TaxID=2169410 RepID=UPI001409DAC7|nr:T9SS type A sorting domain-containing protein [Flavobacterium psychrotolerans]